MSLSLLDIASGVLDTSIESTGSPHLADSLAPEQRGSSSPRFSHAAIARRSALGMSLGLGYGGGKVASPLAPSARRLSTGSPAAAAAAAAPPLPAPELGSGPSAFHPVAPTLAAAPPNPTAAPAELLALAYTLTGYARTLHALAQHERAGALFQEALDVRCRELGEGHHLTLDTRHWYALLLRDMGSLGAARGMLQDTVARRRALLR
jgi:hypothetical protein